jgi:hypothetical protein
MTQHELNKPALLQHAQWAAERAERGVEGILNRTGVLLGAVGVELSLIPASESSQNLKLIAGAFLILTGGLLVVTIWPRRRKSPQVSDFRRVYLGLEDAELTGIMQLIGLERPEDALIPQLYDEARLRGKWFRGALILFMVAQAPLLLMIGGWIK